MVYLGEIFFPRVQGVGGEGCLDFIRISIHGRTRRSLKLLYYLNWNEAFELCHTVIETGILASTATLSALAAFSASGIGSPCSRYDSTIFWATSCAISIVSVF